jgi:hypothetical protein
VLPGLSDSECETYKQMDILSENHKNVSGSDWDQIVEITINLELGPETTEAIESLSIPALRAFIEHAGRIESRQHALKAEALARLGWLEN